MKLLPWRRSPRRTTLLGVAALGLLLWSAVAQVGIEVEVLRTQFIVISLMLLLVMLLAGLAAGLMVYLRRRRSRDRFGPRGAASAVEPERDESDA
ncbi:MAG: type VI protein secretion system component VasK [Halieaceae bacterium]|jgi:type VI protein secretion system component VasK